MNVFLVLAFLFFIGSTVGWILELFYRRIISKGEWINPGFLTRTIFTIIWIWNMCILFAFTNKYKWNSFSMYYGTFGNCH